MQPTFKKMAAIGTAAFVGISYAIKQSISAAQDQERANTRLITIARQVTSATDAEIDGFIRLAEQLQKVGVVGDDVIVAGQSQIASFTKNAEVVSLLSGDLADLAVASYGVNVSQEQAIQTANLMGKALQGQLGALTRTGILVSEEYAAAFAEANTEHERAIVLSAIIADNYGGLNEAMRATSEGGMQALKNDFSDLKQVIGEQFIPILVDVVAKIKPVIENILAWVQENPELTRNIIIAAAALSALVAVIGILGMILIPLKAGIIGIGLVIGVLTSPIGLVILAIGAIIAVIVYWIKNWDDLKETIIWVWDIIVDKIKGGVETLKNVVKTIINFMIDMIEGWVNNWVRGINTVIDAINKLIRAAQRFGIGKGLSTISRIQELNLPRLHSGGFINAPASKEFPIMARGQEAIVPLDKGGFGGITVNVYGDVSGDELIRKVEEGIMYKIKQGMAI